MKINFTLVLFLSLVVNVLSSQSILVVDDSYDTYDNTKILTDALDVLGKTYEVFDAFTEQVSPSAAGLSSYDIVIWHTSTDGQSIQFWNGDETPNPGIQGFLDQGGILWVIGNDYLYDKDTTGRVYQAGEFEYDYLGLESYDFQTYLDDGEIGMKEAIPTAVSPIANLNDIDFIFETLWNGDGVTARDGAIPIYEMSGGAEYPDYVKNGATTGLLNQTDNFTVLSYYFDLALASSDEKVQNNMDAVINYFSSLISNTNNYELKSDITIMPNPASDFITIQSDIQGEFSVSVFDATGAIVLKNTCLKGGVIDVSDFETGLYFLQAETDEGVVVKKLIKY